MSEWKEVTSGGSNYVKFSKPGETFEGRLLGSAQVEGKYGVKTEYQFDIGDGVTATLTEVGELKTKLPRVAAGAQVKITFTGLRDIGRGQPMKCFEVLTRS